MKRNKKTAVFAFAAAYFCLLLLLSAGGAELLFAPREGGISREENRTLQAFPELSRESFFSGAYMDGLESWLSDNIFCRDRLVRASRNLLGIFDIRSGAEQSQGMEDNLAAPPPAAESGETAVPGPEEPAGEEPRETPPPPPGTAPVSDAHTWLIEENGERVHAQVYPAAGLQNAAHVLNALRNELGPDGRVYFLCSPISAVMNSVSQSHKYSAVSSSLDEELQPLTAEGVTVCDAAEILEGHMDEDIFSVLDHHWTELGASYAADWMAENMGLAGTGYYDYRHRLLSDMSASYDRSGLEAIAPPVGDLRFQIPLAPYTFSTLSHLEQKVSCNYLADRPDAYWEYALYMGGCHGPYRLLETGFHTGRCALVIGDSFFQAFVPYLSPYYDSILMLDPRDEWYSAAEAGAPLPDYMEKYSIDDVFVITCDTGTRIDGETYSRELPAILGLSGSVSAGKE